MDALRLYLDQARGFLADSGQALPGTLAAIADGHRSRGRADNKVAALVVAAMPKLRQQPGVANTYLANPCRRRTPANRTKLPYTVFERLKHVWRFGLGGNADGSRSNRCKSSNAQLQF